MDAPASRLIAQPGAPRPVLLGYSGGLDSTVLLHLLAATPALHGGLRAIHVDHGLQPQSADWAVHCARACAALGVPLQVVRVDVRDDGAGPEASARAARHAAFADALHEGEVLALAQHADDQAETFLLRALRASGPDGLAAMREWRPHGRGWLWRPLLETPREGLLAHADAAGIAWIDDPSNADPRFDRNFLRHAVLPLLRGRWPHAGAAFARSASLCGEATALLGDEDARAQASAAAGDPAVLDAGALQALPRARRARVLRRWVDSLGLPPLPASGIAAVEAALLHAPEDADALFEWSGATLRHWRGDLYAGRVRAPLPPDWRCEWDGSAPLPLPDGGELRLEAAGRFEVPVRVHARRGGERILLPGRTHRHALKHVLQELGIPPWIRDRLPLLSDAAGNLLAAGDRVQAAGLAAWLRERGARLAWNP